jgi:hypothetical protein
MEQFTTPCLLIILWHDGVYTSLRRLHLELGPDDWQKDDTSCPELRQ